VTFARYTQITGFILIGIGALSFAAGGMQTLLTAFPALFGFPLVIYGDAANDPEKKARAMHTAVLVAFVGWLLSWAFAWRAFAPRPVDAPWPPGAFIGVLMAAVTTVYITASIIFFVKARKARRAAA
jgi:hypothetical protein